VYSAVFMQLTVTVTEIVTEKSHSVSNTKEDELKKISENSTITYHVYILLTT